MLWYKNWLECKFRVWLCLALAAIMLLVMLADLPQLTQRQWQANASGFTARSLATQWLIPVPPAERVLWHRYLYLFASVVLPMSAIILAGAGINVQTNWGMRQGFHPSMQFLLSLPVSRQRLYWTRVALGWTLVLAMMVLSLASLLVLAPLRGLPLSPAIAVRLLPYLTIGALVYYSVAVVVSAWLDEFWGGIFCMSLTAAITAYSLAGGAGWFALATFIEARPLLHYGQTAWAQGCFYLLLSAALLAAGRYLVNTREY
jgi:hypothetical protein